MNIVLRKEWDRFVVYGILFSFGIYTGAVVPLISVAQSVPFWISLIFSLEFVIGAGCLIYGTFTEKKRLRKTGYAAFCVALITITILILAASPNKLNVIPIALLTLAFAMQFVVLYRRVDVVTIPTQELREMVQTVVAGEEERRNGS